MLFLPMWRRNISYFISRIQNVMVGFIPSVLLQIKDLNSGTFGFVQLARDKHSGETWAVKFIERGDKVQGASVT